MSIKTKSTSKKMTNKRSKRTNKSARVWYDVIKSLVARLALALNVSPFSSALCIEQRLLFFCLRVPASFCFNNQFIRISRRALGDAFALLVAAVEAE